MVSGLVLLPYRRTEVGEIDYRYFFSIDVEQFKHIVTELHYFYHDPSNSTLFFLIASKKVWCRVVFLTTLLYVTVIVVTMTDSQVKFSVGAIQIVLTKEVCEFYLGSFFPFHFRVCLE